MTTADNQLSALGKIFLFKKGLPNDNAQPNRPERPSFVGFWHLKEMANVILFISHVERSCQSIDSVRISIKMQINNKQKWHGIFIIKLNFN